MIQTEVWELLIVFLKNTSNLGSINQKYGEIYFTLPKFLEPVFPDSQLVSERHEPWLQRPDCLLSSFTTLEQTT